MIEKITSFADLIYKSKTQEPYRQLLLISVKKLWAGAGEHVHSYEEALKLFEEYTLAHQNCQSIVSTINSYRNEVIIPRDEEFNRLFELKRRYTDVTIPIVRGEYEYLTLEEGGGGYSHIAQEYERMRRSFEPMIPSDGDIGERVTAQRNYFRRRALNLGYWGDVDEMPHERISEDNPNDDR